MLPLSTFNMVFISKHQNFMHFEFEWQKRIRQSPRFCTPKKSVLMKNYIFISTIATMVHFLPLLMLSTLFFSWETLNSNSDDKNFAAVVSEFSCILICVMWIKLNFQSKNCSKKQILHVSMTQNNYISVRARQLQESHVKDVKKLKISGTNSFFFASLTFLSRRISASLWLEICWIERKLKAFN